MDGSSVSGFCKSVTVSVLGWLSELQLTFSCSDLVTVADAVADID